MPQTSAATDDPHPSTPLATDYHGQPLTEGATVAFIAPDPVTLCQGVIRVIGPRQICIDTGHDLYVFDGIQDRITVNAPVYNREGPTGLYLGEKRIDGGTIVGTVPDGLPLASSLRYPHVALQAAPDGA